LDFGVVREKNEKMTPDLLWLGLTIEWGGPYIGYMGNRERGIQTIGPNLNALGLKIQWIGLLGPNII
jgi:hypothetical protein